MYLELHNCCGTTINKSKALKEVERIIKGLKKALREEQKTLNRFVALNKEQEQRIKLLEAVLVEHRIPVP